MKRLEINNRRYLGNKYKLGSWIKDIIERECSGDIFFDVFAGTGAVTSIMLEEYKEFIINDFLYSNNIIYKAFFNSDKDKYNLSKLKDIVFEFNNLNIDVIKQNYFEINYGGKFFSIHDSRVIGEIREKLDDFYKEGKITETEFNILLASLVYSLDKVANTVGHYEAYIKGKIIKNKFDFLLIKPFDTKDKKIIIYREDSNDLAKKVKSDIAFIDPPYNSRQYSRFYHVLENIVTWKKPQLFGVARKPKAENMSEYCRGDAVKFLKDLVMNLNSKYIVVTYNNTYASKSSSSRNKITLEEIQEILEGIGNLKVFSRSHSFFNSGKTEFLDHKEYLFVVEVKKNEN